MATSASAESAAQAVVPQATDSHSTAASVLPPGQGNQQRPVMTIQAVAAWTLKSGLREFLSELVPALLGLGSVDLDALTRADADKLKDKISKKAMQSLLKKCKATPSGEGEDSALDSSAKKKKRKPTEPVVVPEPTKLEPADLDAVVFINRAPVCQLWGTILCKVVGLPDAESLAIAGSFVRDMSERKRKYLGLYVEKPEVEAARAAEPKKFYNLMGFEVGVPLDRDDLESAAEKSFRYIKNAFGEQDFQRYLTAMFQRARQIGREAIESGLGYSEYERFRPPASHGTKGFGEKGRFRLGGILG